MLKRLSLFSTAVAATLLTTALSTPSWPAMAPDNLSIDECYSCHKRIKLADLDARHSKLSLSVRDGDRELKGCEACHGAGGAHKEAVDKDIKEMRIEAFREGVGEPGEKNNRCLPCHKGGSLNFWNGSGHDLEGVGCTSCHITHGKVSPVKSTVCFKCHPQRRAQYQRSSHMPVREGIMECSSCHNPHGSSGPSMLKKATVNDICYDCHQEKRGPFLWEHAPVRENCSNCHEPHGSNHASLLKTKVPYLCQPCHVVQNHPTTPYSGGGLADATPNKFQLAKGCLNCHPQVHGSNHPSGARFNR